MRTRLQRGFDRLSLYLPVLLMGFLALGSWWLVRSAPKPERTAQTALPADQPDYRLEQFTIQTFGPDGQWRSALSGQSAEHFPTQDRLEVQALQGRSLGRNGQLTTLSADRGQSTDNGHDIQLWGNALVQRYASQEAAQRQTPPEMVLSSEYLHAWPEQERLQSDQPVTITQGRQRLQGQQLDYDHQRQLLQLKGQVRGLWQPPG